MYVANDSLKEFRKTHDRWMLTWLCLALGVYLAVCGALYAWGTHKHVRSIGEHRQTGTGD